MIPRIAHFVFGLEEQVEPFHFLHYASLESCRRVLAPEVIYFHHKNRPWGPWWERIEPYLTLVDVEHVPEVLTADYSAGHVPDTYRYAHHSDFLRLDALIGHGGIYADIDTIFVREFPQRLFEAPFVIGGEPPVADERSGEYRPSLCNALLMAEPGAAFARAWRGEMAAALDGTWSNHSGFLSHELSVRMPSSVRVQSQETFFPFPATPAGLSMLLEQRCPIPPQALSVHLWAHLWWDRRRRDFSLCHGGRYGSSFVRGAHTTLAEMTRPYLPDPPAAAVTVTSAGVPATPPARWSYFSLDEDSGYGVAARRCMAALEDSGVELAWTPLVVGNGWDLFYEPAAGAPDNDDEAEPVIAHVVAEYLPMIRARRPNALLVAHTVWDTDRLPDHWIGCLDEADLIVVPSRFSAEVFERSPVTPPVAIVPHVAPLARSTSQPWPDGPDDVLTFYTIAEWNERKAVFHTIEAYLRAFSSRDRVRLLVKTSRWDARFRGIRTMRPAGEGTTARLVARLLAAHRDPPAVRLITRELSDDEIVGLHRRGDCFVSLARCEGWGLGAFDAAAYGNPVVTTGYGGQLDFLAGSEQLVSYEVTPVDDPAGLPSYAPDQQWAEPDVDHAAMLLREVAADPRRAVELARPIATDIRRRYAPAAIAATFRAAVQSHQEANRRGSSSTPTRFAS